MTREIRFAYEAVEGSLLNARMRLQKALEAAERSQENKVDLERVKTCLFLAGKDLDRLEEIIQRERPR